MKIMGIDPGFADVGWGIVEQNGGDRSARHLAHGVVRTSAKDPAPQRLRKIFSELQQVIRDHAPDVVAIESLFFAANVKTAIVVAQGRGAAILATAESGVPILEYSPPQIKQALVGHGRASKQQIQGMVRAILALPVIPKPDHAADALAAALCHLHSHTRVAQLDAALRAEGGNALVENPNKILLSQTRRKRKRR
jgi:crossover junction endodeoxyribonuclease RuvC